MQKLWERSAGSKFYTQIPDELVFCYKYSQNKYASDLIKIDNYGFDKRLLLPIRAVMHNHYWNYYIYGDEMGAMITEAVKNVESSGLSTFRNQDAILAEIVTSIVWRLLYDKFNGNPAIDLIMEEYHKNYKKIKQLTVFNYNNGANHIPRNKREKKLAEIMNYYSHRNFWDRPESKWSLPKITRPI